MRGWWRRQWFIVRSFWTCLNSFTDRNDQHNVYFCTLRRGHEGPHDDGQGCWTNDNLGWRDQRRASGW